MKRNIFCGGVMRRRFTKKAAVFLTGCVLLSGLSSSCQLISVLPEEKEEQPLMEAEQIEGFESAKKSLSQELQKNYEILDDAVYRLEEEVKFRNLHQDDVRKLVEYYKADHPEVFWLNAEYSYAFNTVTQKISTIQLNFTYLQGEEQQEVSFEKEQIEEMSREIGEQAEVILSGISSEMSDYEKIKYFHDYLASSVSYDTSADFQHTIYGALVEKKAVCDGLSGAFQYLCQKAGIEARMVYGTSSDGVSHAWNVVRLGEDYYHVDITWDMPEHVGGEPFYLNFMFNDEMAMESRMMFSPQEGREDQSYDYYPSVPVCNSLDYWYYLYENLYVEDFQSIGMQGVCQMIEERVLGQQESIQLLFYSRRDFNSFLEEVRRQGNSLQRFLGDDGIPSYQIAVNEENRLVILKPGYES